MLPAMDKSVASTTREPSPGASVTMTLINASRQNDAAQVPTSTTVQASWLNDLKIKSFMSGTYNTMFSLGDYLRISFKSSSKKDPTDSSVFTVFVDQKNANTPWFFSQNPKSEELFHRYYKSLEDLQPHNNLIKYQKIGLKMFSLGELKALLPLTIFSEAGIKHACSLMGRAACFEWASVFCILTQFEGPSLRRWLTATDNEKYSWVWENVERPTQNIPLKHLIKLRIKDDINEGLDFLHCKKFFHNKLKPENIRFSTDDFKFPVKLSNFGLYFSTKYSNESGNGTWNYYDAPELKVGPNKYRYSIQSDTFSFGLVIWELFEEIPYTELNKRFTALADGRFDVVKRDPVVFNLDLLVKNYTAKEPQHRNKSREGSPLKLIVIHPDIIPISYGLNALSSNGGADKPVGRRVEIGNVLKAIHDPSKQMLEIRGSRQTGKTSLLKKIVSKLKGKLNVVIIDEEFDLEKLWNSVCQTVPTDDIVVDITNILSNRMESRWIMIFDMNFSASNPSLISRFKIFIQQFPREKNLSPFVIFTSIDQYSAQWIDSNPVELLTISDWQMDYFLNDASKLGMYANLKGSTSTTSKEGAKQIKAAFKELGIIMKKIKETKKKSEVLTAAVSMLLILGISGGVLFHRLDLLELILSMKFEHEMGTAICSIYNGFLSAKLFAKYVVKDRKEQASETIRSLKCPKSVATVIRKLISKPEYKQLLGKLLGLNGDVGRKRWLLNLSRGKNDNPIAKRCKVAISERKRSGSSAIIRKAPMDRRILVESGNRKVYRNVNFRLRARVRVTNSTHGSSFLQAGDNSLESFRNLVKETKGLGNKLGLNPPNTLDKSVDLIRAHKTLMDEMCEAIHPVLLEKYGNDHQATNFVKSLLPPVVVTLDED